MTKRLSRPVVAAIDAAKIVGIRAGARELKIRAAHPRDKKLLDAIDDAYATKYPTPASRK